MVVYYTRHSYLEVLLLNLEKVRLKMLGGLYYCNRGKIEGEMGREGGRVSGGGNPCTYKTASWKTTTTTTTATIIIIDVRRRVVVGFHQNSECFREVDQRQEYPH